MKSRIVRPGPLVVFGTVLWLLFARADSLAAAPVTCWDAASEFNDSANPDAANPSEAWSYGWKPSLTGKFFLALTSFSDPPSMSGWCSASGFPLINHSTRSLTAVSNGPNRVTVPPHVLGLHPAVNGEYAVLRFIVPADGTYKVAGQFFALDDNGTGTTTDVWILPNNQKAGAFSGMIDYFGGAKWASFTGKEFALKKGNTLDFQVGYGTNKTNFYDSTGLSALIERIK